MTYKSIQKLVAMMTISALISTLAGCSSFQSGNAPSASMKMRNLSGATSDRVDLGFPGNVRFEQNKGQLDQRVAFSAKTPGGASLFLSADGATYALPMEKPVTENVQAEVADPIGSETPEIKPQQYFALKMKLEGVKTDAKFTGEGEMQGRTNYLRGTDPSAWQSDVPSYSSVTQSGVYNGVDLVWHGLSDGATRYDFVVQPNADPNQIKLTFNGADKLQLDRDGNLLIETEAGMMVQNKPFTYQDTENERKTVASNFVISGKSVSFNLGEYDRSKPLTIDPIVNLSNLAYSTFVGGTTNEQVYDVAVDADGYTYITGFTGTSGFPVTPGAYDPTGNGFIDVFVTKIAKDGSGLVFSTFLGGTDNDQGRSIALDIKNNVFVLGTTKSTNFPITANTYDTTANGDEDVFVTKLKADGTGLLYSTYLGSTGIEDGGAIAIDVNGAAYITGMTNSTGFPVTPGAFDTSWNGYYDAFVAKLSPKGNTLEFSTFLGGTSAEYTRGLALDKDNNVYVTGYTQLEPPITFPTTPGAYDISHNGDFDVYVTKLNPTGTSLVYSTFIGESGGDYASNIAVNSKGQAYVTGSTKNPNYPTTAGSYDVSFNGGDRDVFVTKLEADGSKLVFSTFLGGSDSENGYSIALDVENNVYVSSYTRSPNYPVTINPYDLSYNGSFDSAMSVLNPKGIGLLYSTYIGGDGNDTTPYLALDPTGNVYLSGIASHNTIDYPTTPGAFDQTHNGFYDVFVTKFGQ